nr:methyl-accepting chemotaxis protein [Alteromonas antoniana]
MYEVSDIVQKYPDLVTSITGFDKDFNAWKRSAEEVISALQNNNTAQAINLLNGELIDRFDSVRTHYDKVGESIKAKADEVTAEAKSAGERQRNILFLVILIVLVASIISIVVGPKLVTTRLNNLISVMDNISEGEGDLRSRLDESGKDEITILARTFNRLMQNLQSLIIDIKKQADQLGNTVGTLKNSTDTVELNTSEQDSNLDHIATAVNELNHAVHEVAENSQSALGNTQAASDSSNKATDVVTHSSKSITQLNTSVQHANSVIMELANDSKNIVAVLDVIRDIAEQTNLLALNAAIEAARAGEQGRGFAVVADEVRTLASRTQKSTEDINSMLAGLENRVSEAVSAIERGNTEVTVVLESSNELSKALTEVKSCVEKANEMIYQIATATEEQSTVVDEINNNTSSLQSLSQHNLKQVSEAGSVSKEVSEIANALNKNVSTFKV